MPRKFSAHYIFPAGAPPLKHGVVVMDDDLTVTDLIDTGGNLSESQSLIFYNGIITPGFPDVKLFTDGVIPAPSFSGGIILPAINTTIFDQMIKLQQLFPYIHLQDLINWACIDLAQITGMEAAIIKKGNKPGLNLISNVDFSKMQLTSQSEFKVLV